MNHILKALGCTLVLIFAIGAGVTATASAAMFDSEGSWPILTGQDEGPDHTGTTAGAAECKGRSYFGSMSGFESSTFSLEPFFEECDAFGFADAEVYANGCEYVFHNNGTMDIVSCDDPSGFIIAAYLFGTLKCEATIVPQNGINGVTYTNVGTGSTREITIDIESNNTKYRKHGGTGFGACASTSTLQTNGTYSAEILVTAEDVEGKHLGFRYR